MDSIMKENPKQLLDSSLLNLGHELTITVNSMLGFAQLLNIGHNNLTREQQEYLYPFLTRLCSENSGLAFKRRIDYLIDLGPGLGTVQADENRMGRVIKNILHNTIMFTEQDHRAGLESETADGKAVIRIWNDSAPFEGEILDQLLLPYAHKNHRFSMKQNSDSNGIGFYLVRKILQLHNGTLCIENSNGRGNIFELTLPAL